MKQGEAPLRDKKTDLIFVLFFSKLVCAEMNPFVFLFVFLIKLLYFCDYYLTTHRMLLVSVSSQTINRQHISDASREFIF